LAAEGLVRERELDLASAEAIEAFKVKEICREMYDEIGEESVALGTDRSDVIELGHLAAAEAALFAANCPSVGEGDLLVVLQSAADATCQKQQEWVRQAALLRDIFGNPFRPVAFDPSWRTETAVGIARGIYEDRAFERMPILADALEEAGCEHPDILSHCREPGEHVRGCWVVDLVLGKE